jgi:hypothetical protein
MSIIVYCIYGKHNREKYNKKNHLQICRDEICNVTGVFNLKALKC